MLTTKNYLGQNSNKFVLLIFVLTAVFISGCIETKTNTEQALIPTKSLPTGLKYIGQHNVGVDIGGRSVNTTEGIYKNGEDDLYVQVISSENPNSLMDQFRSDYIKKYKNRYNPFEDISLNGHKATRVSDSIIMNGRPITVYSVTWITGKYLVIVGESSDINTVTSLATATEQ